MFKCVGTISGRLYMDFGNYQEIPKSKGTNLKDLKESFQKIDKSLEEGTKVVLICMDSSADPKQPIRISKTKVK